MGIGKSGINRSKAAIFSVSGKIALTVFNFIISIISGSTALVAESAHTFSDVFTLEIAGFGNWWVYDRFF